MPKPHFVAGGHANFEDCFDFEIIVTILQRKFVNMNFLWSIAITLVNNYDKRRQLGNLKVISFEIVNTFEFCKHLSLIIKPGAHSKIFLSSHSLSIFLFTVHVVTFIQSLSWHEITKYMKYSTIHRDLIPLRTILLWGNIRIHGSILFIFLHS